MAAQAETVQQPAHSMRKIFLEKVTINICVGNDKQGMDRAEKLLVKLTGKTPVKNTANRRLATWGIRKGLPIGYKVTLRGNEAQKFLQWALDSKQGRLRKSSLDQQGNFSLGFPEYLELQGIKYDAEIGIMGFELMATFAKPGHRIKRRLERTAKVPHRHKVGREEVIEYLKEQFGVEMY